MFKPDLSKGFIVYVDASFAGDFNYLNATYSSYVLSRIGFIIKYMNFPLFQISKLQTEIALSTEEAEYIALSHEKRETFPVINLLKEIYESFGLLELVTYCQVTCTIFEDNNTCIYITKYPKMRPQTKHIAVKYYYFRSKVYDGMVKVLQNDISQQQAGIFTKGLARDQFQYL